MPVGRILIVLRGFFLSPSPRALAMGTCCSPAMLPFPRSWAWFSLFSYHLLSIYPFATLSHSGNRINFNPTKITPKHLRLPFLLAFTYSHHSLIPKKRKGSHFFLSDGR